MPAGRQISMWTSIPGQPSQVMHQKCNIPVALPSVLIIEGNEGGTLCVFDQWTGDGMHGSLQQDGGGEEGGGSAVGWGGNKRASESGEKRGEQIILSGFFFFSPPLSAHASSFKDAFCSWSSESQHQHLKQDLCVQFRFNLSSSHVLHMPPFFFQSTH